jgi:methylthioribulose-1-phosphate dehydratase
LAAEWDRLPPRAALAEIARDFHTRGWMAATAGNLSARDGEGFWITASGRPKGRLDAADFLLVATAADSVLDGVAPGNRPSAETAIHRTLYRRFPDAQACLHVHSVEACLAGDQAGAHATVLRLPPLEMLKAFDIWQQSPQVDLPLFANHLDVAAIAVDIDNRFREATPALSALLIRHHGVTVWGASLQQAYNRLEAIEFVLRYLSASRTP